MMNDGRRFILDMSFVCKMADSRGLSFTSMRIHKDQGFPNIQLPSTYETRFF
jgi:hypothetical protein